MMDSGYPNLIINDISKKYKSEKCLENLNFIPLWNFLIKKIQKIKINQNLEGSKNRSRLILFLINLIIKLLNKFIIITSITIFSNYQKCIRRE
jgi:hypothetical protein